MENLTEKMGLRKIITVPEYEQQRKRGEEKKGFFASVIEFFVGKKDDSDRLKNINVDTLKELEMGTKVPLREEDWGHHRILIVDKRIKLLEIPGIEAYSSGRETQANIDVTISYRIIDEREVAFEVEDPLRMLYDTVTSQTISIVNNYHFNSLTDKLVTDEMMKYFDEYSKWGIKVENLKARVVLPEDIRDAQKREREAELRKKQIIEEKNTAHEIDQLQYVLTQDMVKQKLLGEHELQDLKGQYELLQLKHKKAVRTEELDLLDLEDESSRKKKERDVKSDLSIDRMKFDHYRQALIDSGFPPAMATLMMPGDDWRRLFGSIKALIDVDSQYKGEKIKAHYALLEKLLAKDLNDETKQDIVEWIKKESELLNGGPSPLQQFSALADSQKPTGPKLNAPTESSANVDQKDDAKNHTIDDGTQVSFEDKEIDEKDASPDTIAKKYPKRGEKLDT